jgi:hypothetical protein
MNTKETIKNNFKKSILFLLLKLLRRRGWGGLTWGARVFRELFPKQVALWVSYDRHNAILHRGLILPFIPVKNRANLLLKC